MQVRKLMDWNKDSLIGKVKAACANKAKQGIHAILAIGKLIPISRKAEFITCKCYLGRQAL